MYSQIYHRLSYIFILDIHMGFIFNTLACPRVFFEELLVRSRERCAFWVLWYVPACKVVLGNTEQLEPLGGHDWLLSDLPQIYTLVGKGEQEGTN